MTSTSLTLAAALLLSITVRSVVAATKCVDEGVAQRCIPPFENAVKLRDVVASNTCGSPPRTYCLLTDTRAACVMCNASSPTLNHNEEYLTDENDNDNPTWWQSDTYTNWPDTLEANLTISLGKGYDVTFVKIKFYSPRPRTFAIHRSSDFGRTFQPWQFYAASCSYYNTTRVGTDKVYGDSEAICTDEFSNIVPLSGGTVTFATVENRESTDKFDSSVELQDWVTATDVRVQLSQPNTFGDEIYNVTRTLRSYYYAVQDLSIGARCKCNGHASRCVEDETTGMLNCECQHGTTGRDCERCLPFFQGRPWRRATGNDVNDCLRCDCNGHSMRCVLDERLYERTADGGVCLNCGNNTEGQHCERCIVGYYLGRDKTIDMPNPCQECRCNPNGVTTSGCNSRTGQCPCKPNVEGRKCNRCKPEHWNLQASNSEGCSACDCFSPGTIDGDRECDKSTGQCRCKDNVVGRRCNQCRDGFYGLDNSNPVGCTPCNCYPAGSQDTTCNKDTGACTCWPNVFRRDCSEPRDGYFFPRLDFLTYEAEDGTGSFVFDTSVDGHEVVYTGRGVAIIVEGNSIIFPIVVAPLNARYNVYIRYTLDGFVNWGNLDVTISPGRLVGTAPICRDEVSSRMTQSVTEISPGVAVSRKLDDALCLRGGRSYTIELTAGSPSSDDALRRLLVDRKLIIDSIVLIPIPEELVQFESDVVDIVSNCERVRSAVSTRTGNFRQCEAFEAEVTTMLNDGVTACDCDLTGSQDNVCEKHGGQCSCKVGFGGRRCDRCIPGHYELLSECKPCSCDVTGSVSGVCDLTTGQCPCLPGVANMSNLPGEAGRRCTQCLPRLFGFSSGEGCEECRCNLFGSTSVLCSDDGKCDCRRDVTGATCDQCIPDHHRLTITGCVSCECDPAGSENLDCDTDGICSCKNNTRGTLCIDCEDYAFNKNEDNPYGCQKCFCFGHSVGCDSASGFVMNEISSDFDSDDDGWSSVDSRGDDWTLDYRKGKKAVRVISDGANDVFFVAPEKFLGDLRKSYMMKMSFQLRFTTDEPSSQAQGQDVFIESSRGTVFASLDKLPTNNMQTFEIRLDEFAFQPVTRSLLKLNMIDVLSSVSSIRVRASYVPGDKSTILLYNFKLETAVEGDNGTFVRSVEQCVCPPSHTSLSCELCASGYKRERPGLGPRSNCVPCECNNHSNTCDSDTGVCSECKENTQGNRCQLCAVGYYGDATRGSPSDCRRCPCPYATDPGRFGAACEVTLTGDIVCSDCLPGHTGSRCEVCMDGYFGDPLGRHGNVSGCSDCRCNGNIDLDDTGNCNRSTGECLKCTRNTAGRFCQMCKPGYFGDAITAKNCIACSCNRWGTEPGDLCDHRTGVCNCKRNVEGDDCGRCIRDHYGLQSGNGCTSCDCDPVGSNSSQCDSNGQCRCKVGVEGEKCDVCSVGYYRLSETGCSACGCDPRGSADLQCNNVTGVCMCKAGVMGEKCDQCMLGTHDLDRGCVECPECFRQVKAVYDRLIAKMKELEVLLRDVPTGGRVSSEDFDKALQQTREDISRLLNDTKDAKSRDEFLIGEVDRLDELIRQFGEHLSRINITLIAGESSGNVARNTVINSESVVIEIVELINNIRDRIKNGAQRALDDANAAAESGRGQQRQLQRILADAKRTADGQEMSATEIEMDASDALIIARNANQIAKDAVELQKKAITVVEKLVDDISNASMLANQAEQAVNDATRESKEVLDKSKRVLELAKMPLSSIDSEGLVQRASDALGNASQLVADAMKLLQDNIGIIRFVRGAKADVDKLLEEGKKSQQLAAQLLAIVNAAKYRAENASNRGRLLLSEAEMLKEKVEDITETLEKTKRDILRALDAIKKAVAKKIKTRELSKSAQATLDAARSNASEALRVGKLAEDLAQKAATDSMAQKERSEQALRDAESVLATFLKLEEDANATYNSWKSLDEEVSRQTGRIAAVAMTANLSQTIATRAGKEATSLQRRLGDMDRLLKANGTLDTSTLDWIEQQLAGIETSLNEFQVSEVIKEFEARDTEQRRQIADYDIRLDVLEGEVLRLQRINASIPGPPTCFARRDCGTDCR